MRRAPLDHRERGVMECGGRATGGVTASCKATGTETRAWTVACRQHTTRAAEAACMAICGQISKTLSAKFETAGSCHTRYVWLSRPSASKCPFPLSVRRTPTASRRLLSAPMPLCGSRPACKPQTLTSVTRKLHPSALSHAPMPPRPSPTCSVRSTEGLTRHPTSSSSTFFSKGASERASARRSRLRDRTDKKRTSQARTSAGTLGKVR